MTDAAKPNLLGLFHYKDETLEVSGDWYDAPLHFRWQKHRASLQGNDGGFIIHRCSCGAYGPAPWTMLGSKPTYRKLRGPKRRKPLVWS